MDNENERSDNPFQTPISSGASTESSHGDGETAHLLRQTRPWTLTIGVLLCIASVMMIVGGMILAGAMAFMSAGQGPMEGALGIAMGVMYAVFGLFYAIPAIWLFKYSSRISSYVHLPTVDNLNRALAAQKSFWKFCGIGAIVLIALYVVVIIGAMAVGMVSTTQSAPLP